MSPSSTQRPLRIGISACFFHADPERNLFKGKTLTYVEESMSHYVMSQGAIPYMIPRILPGFALEHLVQDLDGLILHGGADLAPESYGETPIRPEWSGDAPRDAYEIELMRAFLAADKPVFGICRGAQLINVALGGTLFQDICYQQEGALLHRNWHVYDAHEHELNIDDSGYLRDLYGTNAHRINSIHHQGIKDLGKDLVVEARSPEDGIVEAIRSTAHDHVVGVQWHPEFQEDRDLKKLPREPLLRDFLAAAARRRDQTQ